MKRICTVLAALSLILAASCEKYDDSGIKESISSLEERIEKLEKLNGEIEVLKKIVQDKLLISKYKEENGKYYLTLSDGEELVFYSQENSVPFITVVEDDDVLYWATYTDGQTSILQIDDKGVKVESSVVPQVRAGQDGYLEISVDNGNSWEKTDAKLGDGVFSAVQKQEESIIFTLADGVTRYEVPLVLDSEVEMNALSGPQFFTAGETKTVLIQMIGIDDYTITEKPEGWKTVLTNGELKVTAPAEGTGDECGYIKILGVGKETKIAKVFVTIGSSPCLVTISSTLQVNIKPNPTSCFYGACTMDEFDATAIAQELSGVSPMMARKPFTSSELNLPLEDLVDGDVIDGETYVVWAFPISESASDETDVVYQAISSIGVQTEVSNVTYENASISVRVTGTDTYYIVPMEEEMTVDDVISDLQGAYAATYDRYRHSSNFRGTLLDIIDKSKAGETYTFLVLPVKYGENLSNEAVTFIVKLNPYTTGGQSVMTIELGEVDFNSISTEIKGDNCTYRMISAIVATSEYDSKGYDSDETLLGYLTTLDAKEYPDEGYTYTSNGLESGTKYWVVAVAIDVNGCLGAPARLEVTTKTVEYSSVVVSIGNLSFTQNSANVPLIVTGGEVQKYRYMFLSSNEAGGYWYNTYFDNNTAAYEALIYGTYDYIEVAVSQVSSGLSFEGLVFGTKYLLCLIGYDSEGKITNLVKSDFQLTVGKVIENTEEQWITAKPSILTSIASNSLKLNVTFPEGVLGQFVVTMMSSEEYSANVPTSARQKTDYVLGHSNALTFEDNLENYQPDWYIGADKPYLLITWKDEDGWYEPLVYDTKTGTVLN